MHSRNPHLPRLLDVFAGWEENLGGTFKREKNHTQQQQQKPMSISSEVWRKEEKRDIRQKLILAHYNFWIHNCLFSNILLTRAKCRHRSKLGFCILLLFYSEKSKLQSHLPVRENSISPQSQHEHLEHSGGKYSPMANHKHSTTKVGNLMRRKKWKSMTFSWGQPYVVETIDFGANRNGVQASVLHLIDSMTLEELLSLVLVSFFYR